MSRIAGMTLAVLFASSLALGQDKPKVEPPKVERTPPAAPGKPPPAVEPSTGAKTAGEPGVEVQFSDGSIVKLALLETKIDVTTRYGKLSVPMSEIRRIEMGLRYPDGALPKIQSAIAQLGDPDFKKREAASTELVAFRELAYPIVRRAVQTGNAEAQKRAKAVLEEIRKRLPEEKLAVKDLDTITTADFPIAGHIEATSFKASSPLLGNVEVKLFQVRGIRWLGHTSEIQVTVDGSKHGGPQENWLDTGIDLNGDRLVVQASGTVDVMPNNPGQFMAGPDGLRADLGFRPGQGGAMVGQPGALIAKIGQSGQPFLIGSKHDSTPRAEGRLYLRLEPSPWRVNQSGSFSVKISTGK
jgi:hypothetical protein